MKKVLFTEQQINRILGEEFTAYLADTSDAIPDIANGCEISVSDDIDGEKPDAITSDAYEDEFEGGRIRYTGATSKFSPMCESNSDFKDDKLTYGRFQDKIKITSANNNGDKLLYNMSHEENFSPNAAYVRLNRLKKQAQEDPIGFANRGGKQIASFLKNTIENKKKESKNSKETKKKMGFQNVYQKPGGTKNSKNGQAHTKKPKNGKITIEN